jgi:transcriptional regulator with XRE-family HTH domain
MTEIKPSQVRAARALLDWSQGKLAKKAGLSMSSVRSVENNLSTRTHTMKEIRKTFESEGIEFSDNDGVKRVMEKLEVFRGPDSCDEFFNSMKRTLEEHGGGVIAVIKTQSIMVRSSGATYRTNLQRLELLDKSTDIKCIISDAFRASFLTPALQCRVIAKETLGPTSYFMYGDKQASISLDDDMHFMFAVFNIPYLVREHKNHFLSLWEKGSPPRS